MKVKDINIDEIGSIRFEKKSRAKRLKVSIRPFKGIKVTVPVYLSYAIAEQFVLSKQDWIKASLEKIKKIESEVPVFKPGIDFQTREHVLYFIPDNSEKLRIKISLGRIDVFYPATVDFSNFEVQRFIRKGIEEALRIEAKKYLPERVSFFSEKYGFKYNKVSVRNSKSRWGSCSGKNNINLSLHLMILPDELVDFVILHELCHTVCKSHGERFWKLLIKYAPDARNLDRQLKNHKISWH